MQLVKRIALEFARAVFRISLFTGIGLLAIWWVFLRSPDAVKQTLQNNNAYSQFIEGVISENKDQTGGLPLSDPKVETIVKDVFTPTLLRSETERFIDESYVWLNGSTSDIEYQLDVSAIRLDFANKFGDYAVTRLEFLPACNYMPPTFDPLTTDCKPPNINTSLVREAAKQSILQSSILPLDNNISASKLTGDSAGESATERFNYAPLLFQLGKIAPWLLLIIALASAWIIIKIQPFRRGWREIGITMISASLGLAVFTYLFVFLLPDYANNNMNNPQGGELQLLMQSISNDLLQQTQALIINIAIQIAVLGVVILIIERFTRPASSYANLRKKSGLTSSHTPKKSLQLGKSAYDDIPVVSSEGAKKKRKPKARKKMSKAQKIAKGLE